MNQGKNCNVGFWLVAGVTIGVLGELIWQCSEEAARKDAKKRLDELNIMRGVPFFDEATAKDYKDLIPSQKRHPSIVPRPPQKH